MTVNKLPRTGTITRRLLEFVSRHNGVRFGQMQRFICEISGLDYDQMEVVTEWGGKKKTVRRFRGWWCTNLCYGEDAVCRKYLAKKDGKWYLNEVTADLFRELANRTGQSNVIYSISQVTPTLASTKFPDPLPVEGPTPTSKHVGQYTDPTKLTGAATFDPSTGVRLEFVPKVELPLGPTLPEGTFKIRQPVVPTDVDLVQALRNAQANVEKTKAAAAASAAAHRDAIEALFEAQEAVRKALNL